MLDWIFKGLAGALTCWWLTIIWRIVRVKTCKCWEHFAKFGDLEVPRNWEILGATYWQCPRCGKRFVRWDVFCELLKLAEETWPYD